MSASGWDESLVIRFVAILILRRQNALELCITKTHGNLKRSTVIKCQIKINFYEAQLIVKTLNKQILMEFIQLFILDQDGGAFTFSSDLL